MGYIGFTQFYPWVKLTVLPNWFYPLGKTTMPTLSISLANKCITLIKHQQYIMHYACKARLTMCCPWSSICPRCCISCCFLPCWLKFCICFWSPPLYCHMVVGRFAMSVSVSRAWTSVKHIHTTSSL